MIRTALCLAAIASLAACGDTNEAPATSDDGRSAEGDVLSGSISDEMLPLDQLQSTSPPARETASSSSGSSGSNGSTATEAAPASTEPAPAEPAAPEPAAPETPEPESETEAE